MRKSIAALTVLATLFLSMPSAIADDSPKEEKVIKLPQGVKEYYQANNFIVSFSSADERSMAGAVVVARHLCKGKSLDTGKAGSREEEGVTRMLTTKRGKIEFIIKPDGQLVPTESSCKLLSHPNMTKRLKRVEEQLAIINQRVMRVDPRFAISSEPYSDSMHDRFFQIEGVRCRKDEMAVEVSAHQINAESQFRFVSNYRDEASIEENLRGAEKSLIKSDARQMIEIHRWTFINDKWMKHEADLLLLEPGKSATPLTDCN